MPCNSMPGPKHALSSHRNTKKEISLIPYTPHFTVHWLLCQSAQTEFTDAAGSVVSSATVCCADAYPGTLMYSLALGFLEPHRF